MNAQDLRSGEASRLSRRSSVRLSTIRDGSGLHRKGRIHCPSLTTWPRAARHGAAQVLRLPKGVPMPKRVAVLVLAALLSLAVTAPTLATDGAPAANVWEAIVAWVEEVVDGLLDDEEDESLPNALPVIDPEG